MKRLADDLFAGAGGWDIAAAALGFEARGVELMPEAVATRDAAGLVTSHGDVWTFTPDGRAEGLIASPPCQTFSLAGKGAGRKALDAVLAVLPNVPDISLAELREEGAAFGDPENRTALVLTPLWFATHHAYRWLAWEQVPAVLPLWEACAAILRDLGWHVWTGMVYAEQYGVPQTRKRAVLLASRDHEVGRPKPTHSRYHNRSPKRLDEGVQPWVSMAEALGWGMLARPYPTVASGTEAGGGTDPAALGGSGARAVVYGEREAGRWIHPDTVQRSNYTDHNESEGRTLRDLGEPSVTLTGRPPSWLRHNAGERDRPRGEDGRLIVRDGERDYYLRFPTDGPAPTITGAAGAWKWDDAEQAPEGGWQTPLGDVDPETVEYVNGTHEHAARRPGDRPAPTVMFGARVNTVEWQLASGTQPNAVARPAGEPAPTLAFGHDAASWVWCPEGMTPAEVREWKAAHVNNQSGTDYDLADQIAQPATVVAGRDLVPFRGANANRFNGSTKSRNDGIRITVAEAAVLQTFPSVWPFEGNKGKKYLQVGNAVPPTLALHLLIMAIWGQR